jgi:hypothetical protein
MLTIFAEQSDYPNLALLSGFALDDGSFVIHSICGMLLVHRQNRNHVLLCKEVKVLDCIAWLVCRANELTVHGKHIMALEPYGMAFYFGDFCLI